MFATIPLVDYEEAVYRDEGGRVKAADQVVAMSISRRLGTGGSLRDGSSVGREQFRSDDLAESAGHGFTRLPDCTSRCFSSVARVHESGFPPRSMVLDGGGLDCAAENIVLLFQPVNGRVQFGDYGVGFIGHYDQFQIDFFIACFHSAILRLRRRFLLSRRVAGGTPVGAAAYSLPGLEILHALVL